MSETRSQLPSRVANRTLAQSVVMAVGLSAFWAVSMGMLGGVGSRFTSLVGLVVGLASCATGPLVAMTLTTPPRRLPAAGRLAMWLLFVALTGLSLVAIHVLQFAVVTLLHPKANASAVTALALGWAFFKSVVFAPGTTAFFVVLAVLVALIAWARTLSRLR